jgi:hypothetical protein
VRHEVRVREQHARRIGVRAKHADGLARLDQQRLVVFELLQRRENLIEAVPIARGAPNAAVDDERMRMFGHLGIEVVLNHPVGGFRQPALAGFLGAARRADRARRIEARVEGFRIVHESPRLGSAQKWPVKR